MSLIPAATLAGSLVLVVACSGGGSHAPPPEDKVLERTAHAARLALELGRTEEAARLYGQALARARERDDGAAIADAGFGRATAELEHGDPAMALATAREVRGELARHGWPAPPALLLAEAAALLRLGERTAADVLASEVLARVAEDPEAGARAAFLRGLIAAERGDRAGLAAMRSALGEPSTAGQRGDAAELAAYTALLGGDVVVGGRRAAEAAAARREALDYRGLSRALALQAEAALRGGDTARAADLFLRAGRSAAARGEAVEARRWLGEARRLAAQGGPAAAEVDAAARAELTALREHTLNHEAR